MKQLLTVNMIVFASNYERKPPSSTTGWSPSWRAGAGSPWLSVLAGGLACWDQQKRRWVQSSLGRLPLPAE
jgi:hypothetical protein